MEGSPVIAARSGIEYLRGRPSHNLLMYLIEDDPKQVEQLEVSLKPLQPYPPNLEVNVRRADSRSYIPELVRKLGPSLPAFILMDPYGHPLPVPVINQFLARRRTEVRSI